MKLDHKRVTFITSSLSSGGAERVMSVLANEIAEAGYQVKIIKANKREPHYPLNNDIELVTLASASLKNRFFRYACGVWNLRKELKKEQDHSGVFISFLTNILSPLLKPRNIPIIISERNAHYRVKSVFLRIIRRCVYPRADLLTVQFPEDADYYRKWLPNVEIVRNPCGFEGQEDVSEKENLVIVVSRLHHTKNVSMFLRAVSLLYEDLRSSHRFCVLGEGSLRELLEQEAEALGVQVEFLGAVKNVEDYYRKAKIICLCSHVEGMPNVLIESLFFETARISTKSSGGTVSLIEDGVDGFLVEKNDAHAMSEKMALLMRDEDFRRWMVEQANKKRELFDVKNIANQWIDLIHKVRERHGRAGKG